jgi:hypothetical protein
MSRLRSLVLLPLLLAACADAPLMSESTDTAPPDTTPYDPSQGGMAATAYATGGDDTIDPPTTSATDTDGTTGEPPPPMCDDASKRCEREFTLPDSGETTVELRGDFAPGAWRRGWR